MDKDCLLRNISRRKVILFGAGGRAKEFYKKFSDNLCISYCVSNNQKEKVLSLDNSVVCEVKPATQMKKNEDEFIIICANDSASIQTQLNDMGYYIGKDYINSELYSILVENKKLALFYGVCYMRGIKECLNYSKIFTDNYNSYYFLDYVKYNFAEQALFYFLIEICDLFIYTSYISPGPLQRLDTFFKRLKSDCIKISIPVITFTGFHPRRVGKVNDTNQYCVISAKAPYSPFSIQDTNINYLIDINKTSAEIIDIISNTNYYSRELLESNLSSEFNRLKLIERFSDIKITDYIVENYNESRLFLNESHVSNEILTVLAKRVLNYLELSQDIAMDKVEILPPLLNTSETPLYPCVIEQLDLKQYKGLVKYKLFTYQGIKLVTFEEYVTMYVEFCSNIKRYIEQGFFPN